MVWGGLHPKFFIWVPNWSSIDWKMNGMQVPESWNFCWRGRQEFQKLELALPLLLKPVGRFPTYVPFSLYLLSSSSPQSLCNCYSILLFLSLSDFFGCWLRLRYMPFHVFVWSSTSVFVFIFRFCIVLWIFCGYWSFLVLLIVVSDACRLFAS